MVLKVGTSTSDSFLQRLMMFVKQKRFIDLFIDLIYWLRKIFYPRSIHERATNTIRENAACAAWQTGKLSRQLRVKRI